MHCAADQFDAIPGDEAGQDAADKPSPQRPSQQPADHAGRKARTVGNRVGDVARQQRHHQQERLVTHGFERRRQGAGLLESMDAEHKRQGDQQAPRHHHRQHIRHAGEQVFVDAGFLRLGRCTAGRAFHCAFGEGLVEDGFGLLESNAGATAVNLLAGETLGGHFDIGREQYHIGIGNRLRAQRRAGAHRTLGLDLQVITQALSSLLQGFGGHERVGHTGGARGNRDDTRRSLGRHRGGVGDIHPGFFGAPAQHAFDIRQCLGRCALEHTLADKPLHLHRGTADQQHPLGIINRRLGQLALRALYIDDFNTGVQAHALGGGVQQAGAQHTGDHAVRAGGNNG